MSEQTKTALDEAIAAHVADEYDGDTTTAWVVVTETTPVEMMLDGSGGVLVIESRDLQSDYLTQGLLHAALNVNRAGDDY